MQGRRLKVLNERGVALMIVLLATALLIALVFEFASGTRISLRAARNYRDSMRAYYLARSGVNFAGNVLSYLLRPDATGNIPKYEYLEIRDPFPVPFLPGGDMKLDVWWSDEIGKINVSNLSRGSDAYNRLSRVFQNRGIDLSILDQMRDVQEREQRKFYLVTELHQFLSDDLYDSLVNGTKGEKGIITVLPPAVASENPLNKIDINTAPSDVLQSVGIDTQTAERITEMSPIKDPTKVNDIFGPDMGPKIASQLFTSNVFRVKSFATVGGYTKQVEAVILRSNTGFKVLYWRSL